MNDVTVIAAAQGLAAYLLATRASASRPPSVVIGWDHRARGSLSSYRFALLCGAAFRHSGITVHLCSRLACTPIVPYGVLKLGADAGLMVTASHNPKADAGLKVYAGNGSQIVPPVDVAIAAAIRDPSNATPWSALVGVYALSNAELEARLRGDAGVTDPLDDLWAGYTADTTASQCRRKAANAGGKVRITYTAMHGVGTPYMLATFAAFGHPAPALTTAQCTPDPEFSTVAFPNPEEGRGALALAIATAEAAGSTLILANDPDADRLAVAERGADGEWRVFSGNELGILLAGWVWQGHVEGGGGPAGVRMVSSAVSSAQLAAMARVEGFQFTEVLTGFKWMGNEMAAARGAGERVLFAYEEAIGFACGDVVRDKDGVCAAAVVAEMAQAEAETGGTLAMRLAAADAKYGAFERNNGYLVVDDPAKTTAMFDRLRNGGHYWARGGPGLVITGVRDLTSTPTAPGGYDSSTPDGLPRLPVSAGGQFLTYTFGNGVRLNLRSSGTEPKLKWYAELGGGAGDRGRLREELARTVRIVVDEFLQPQKYGLKRPDVG